MSAASPGARPVRRGYKFMRPGGRGIDGAAWAPGEWVSAENGRPRARVCAPGELGWWIAEELWEAEGDGDAEQATDGTLYERARLVRRLDLWTEAWPRFAALCREQAARAREGSEQAGLSGDLVATLRATPDDRPALLGYAAAVAAAAASLRPSEQRARFAAARAAQSAWIAAELGLRTG